MVNKKKKNEVNEHVQSLLKKLSLLSSKSIQKKTGTSQVTNCMFVENWIVASDGMITIGIENKDNLNCCPNTFQLIEGLKHIGEDFSFALKDRTLFINSGIFTAAIPCVDHSELYIPFPDEKQIGLDNSVKNAFTSLSSIPDEKNDITAFKTVCSTRGSLVATNGCVVIEQDVMTLLEGFEFPQMVIPVKAAKIIGNQKSNLIGYGYSGPSVTFFFDGYFIKTELYKEPYPEYRHVFNRDSDSVVIDVPDEFFKKIKNLSKLSKGRIYIENGVIRSMESVESASSYIVSNIPCNMEFEAKYLLMCDVGVDKMAFCPSENKVIFYGEDKRVVVNALDKGQL